MRAPVLVLSILLLFSVSLMPAAAAESQPGCNHTVTVDEICDVYEAKAALQTCAKNLRWCIFGPI